MYNLRETGTASVNYSFESVLWSLDQVHHLQRTQMWRLRVAVPTSRRGLASMAPAPLPCQRHLFPGVPDNEETCYLNAAYMSPSLAASEAAWTAGGIRKSTPWSITKPDFYAGPEQLRAATATLIGADSPDCVALVPSGSYGIAVAAKNLAGRLSSASNLVTLGGEHTSNRFVWQQLAAEVGATMSVVPPPFALPTAAGGAWGEAVLERIDADTEVVAVTPAFWLDGTMLPLEPIAARCREVGAALVIDATQWAGAAPLDVDALQPDFVVGAGYKWLLWPYGLGFLYAAPQHHGGEGLEQHGWADREQRSGRGLAMWGLPGGERADGTLDLFEHHTARRFDMGGRPFLESVPSRACRHGAADSLGPGPHCCDTRTTCRRRRGWCHRTRLHRARGCCPFASFHRRQNRGGMRCLGGASLGPA